MSAKYLFFIKNNSLISNYKKLLFNKMKETKL